ncbi:MFS transporter [Populibacterium corticicola]|uniref:MFS transporter n=1 Tax=Populibacterium corticicola TaxID=1812826 RepID=A0ABW5XD30_9MICO
MSEATIDHAASTSASSGQLQGTPNDKIKVKERLAYASGDIGSNLIFATLSAFALFFLTDVAGVGAAIAGTILLLGQILNGITDLVLGYLIDKTRSRWGKTRPWILWTSVPMGLAFIAIFAVPSGLSDNGKAAWALIFYTLVMAVFFTASNLAYSALLSLITPDSKVRVTLTSMRFFFAVITTLVVTAVTLPAVEALGGGQGGWVAIAIIYAIIAVISLLLVFVGTRERIDPMSGKEGEAKQPIGKTLGQLFRNRYFLLAAAMFLLFYFLNGLSQASGIYFTTVILGDANLFGLVSATGILPMVIGIPFMPWLMGRFGKRRVFLFGMILALIGVLIPAFGPSNLALVLTGGVVRGFGLVPLTAGAFALVADVVDYSEWKNGVRADGLIFSVVIFGQKVGGGVAAAAVGWLLSMSGYVAGVSAQSEAAQNMLLTIYIWIPVVLSVLLIVVIWFFRIERHRPEVEAHLAQRTQSADESA